MTAAKTKGMPAVPVMMGNELEHRRQIAQAVNRHNIGLINCHQDLTLIANATSTTIFDHRIGFNTAIIPAMAMTADAAADIGTIWVDGIRSGTSTTVAAADVHHRSNAATDRTIRFVLLG